MTGIDLDNQGWVGRWAPAFRRWYGPAMVFMAALVVLSAFFAHDRGLDITDEAYYVLSASQPEDITAYISPQHWILAPLWAISGDMASFRLIGLLMLLLSSALLSCGVFAAAQRLALTAGAGSFASVFACSLIGAVLYLTTINLSPSYNLMASVGSYGAIGLSLLAGVRRSLPYAVLLAFLTGLMLTVEFASKPSSGISTFLLLAVFLWASTQHLGKALFLWGVIGLGFGSSLVCLVLAQAPWSETRAALQAGYELFRVVQSEPIALRLLRYAQEYFGYLLSTAIQFLPVLAALTYFLFRPSARAALLWLLVLLGTLTFGGHFLGGTADAAAAQFVRQVGPLLLMLLASLSLFYKVALRNRYLALLISGLFLAPYSVAIGTGNALFTQVIVTLAPWGALIALVPALANRQTHRVMTAAIAVIFAVTASSQIVTSLFRSAYHLNAPLIAQTEMTDAGRFGHVRLDAETALFVNDLKAAAVACKIPLGATYLGLYNNPGLAIILHARTVTSPWINNLEQGEILLPSARVSVLKNVIVGLNVDYNGTRPELPIAIRSLEAEFRNCGTATYPFAKQKMEIWFKAE